MAKRRLDVDQDTIPGTDTELSTACDAVLTARDATASAKSEQVKQEDALLETMHKLGKKSIKHGGYTFRASHQDAKDKLQIVTE